MPVHINFQQPVLFSHFHLIFGNQIHLEFRILIFWWSLSHGSHWNTCWMNQLLKEQSHYSLEKTNPRSSFNFRNKSSFRFCAMKLSTTWADKTELILHEQDKSVFPELFGGRASTENHPLYGKAFPVQTFRH